MKRRQFVGAASALGVPVFAGLDVPEASGSAVTESDTSPEGNSGFPPTSEERRLGIQPRDDRYSAGNVRRYGAAGDGTTDDTDALQTAIRASRAVHFPEGVYLVSRPLQLRSGSSLQGAGAATLRTNGTSYIVRAVGVLGQWRTLARDVRGGDGAFAVSGDGAAEYATAGGFAILSDAIPLGHPSHRLGEVGTVTGASGQRVLVDKPMFADYRTADEARSAPATFVTNISIRGLRLVNDKFAREPSTPTSALVYLEFVAGFQIRDCVIEGNNGAGINAFNCLDGSIVGNRIRDLRDSSGILGYGVQIGFSSQSIAVCGNSFSTCRHAVTTGTGSRSSRTPNYGVSRGLVIAGNVVANCTNAGLDTHEDSDGVTINGNSVVACRAAGIHVRSYGTSIAGNAVSGCTGAGIKVSKTALHTTVSDNIVRHVRARSGRGYGILIDGPGVTLNGNRVSDCDGHGIVLDAHATRDISVIGNSCVSNGKAGRGHGIHIACEGAMSCLTIAGNTCSDDQADATQRVALAISSDTVMSPSTCLIANNNFGASRGRAISDEGKGRATMVGNLVQA